ncbi:MAG: DUF3631 domain-containing protein [Candidatus Binatia bacterium]
MINVTAYETDPYAIDPLSYLENLNENLAPNERLEHYHVLRPALLRLQSEDPAAFDLVVKEISNKLKISGKVVKADLARMVEPPVAQGARELLEQMGQTRPLRLSQDYVDGKLWYGVLAGENKLLLNSDRELLTLDQVPDSLAVKDGGFDQCQISKEAILRFLSGQQGYISGASLLNDLRQFFARFTVFRDNRVSLLLATWTLGTYCYRIFRVFPYLALRSPNKRCGKSRVLDILSLVAFNASPKTVHPTEAQLFRDPSRNGGTLLLDEVEALGRTHKDTYAGLLSVLNSGFEQNGTVQRQEKDANGNYRGVNFETFCPRAIAGINKTADTLEDRSFIIVMQRKLAREKTERFSPFRLADEAQLLRDRCYIWALTHAPDLAAVYEQADKFFQDLDVLDDRARDLLEPLVSITAVADVERDDGQKTLTKELTSLAVDLCQVRDGAAEDSATVQVVRALQAILLQKRNNGLLKSDKAVTFPPTELASLLKEKLHWEKLSTKALANLLNPLGFYSKSTRDEPNSLQDQERGRRYHLTEEALNDLSARYDEPSEEEEKIRQ